MHPIIAAGLVHEHRGNLLRQAEQHRRVTLARAARPHAAPATVTHRAAARPFVFVQGWLARAYL